MWDILAKNHKEWIKMATSICKDVNLANDIVQDMYVRLNKYVDNPEKIIKNGEVNPFFIYITLRNLFYDSKKAYKQEISKDYKDVESIRLLSGMAEVPEERKKRPKKSPIDVPAEVDFRERIENKEKKKIIQIIPRKVCF